MTYMILGSLPDPTGTCEVYGCDNPATHTDASEMGYLFHCDEHHKPRASLTEHQIIEQLARAAAQADGLDPNGVARGPIGLPTPWYLDPTDETRYGRWWHEYIKEAEQFLRFQAMELRYNQIRR